MFFEESSGPQPMLAVGMLEAKPDLDFVPG